jgi:primosomal protein N'
MTDQREPTATARCPQCEREPDLGADEPVTHCEWCGAEYPIPGQDPSPAEETQTDQNAAERTDA